LSQAQSTLPEVLQIDKINNYLSLYSTLIISACTVIVFQIPFGLIFNKMPINLLTYLSVIFMVIAFLLFAIAKSTILFIIAIVLLSIAEVIESLTINVIVDTISPENMRGIYFGAVNLGTLGLFLGPVVGGVILQFGGSHYLYLSIAIIVSISILLYYKFNLLVTK
jgi:MFS family permease